MLVHLLSDGHRRNENEIHCCTTFNTQRAFIILTDASTDIIMKNMSRQLDLCLTVFLLLEPPANLTRQSRLGVVEVVSCVGLGGLPATGKKGAK